MKVIALKLNLRPARFVLGCLVLALTLTNSAAGQTQRSSGSLHRIPFTIAPEVGLGPSMDSDRCSYGGYGTAGLRLATRGVVYAGIALLAMAPPFGGSGCDPLVSARIEGDEVVLSGRSALHVAGTMANVDIGFRSPRKLFIFRPEVAFRAGAVIGQDEFESTWMPSLGGVASVAIGRAYIGFEVMHIRTPQWELRMPASEWNGALFGWTRTDESVTRWNWNELRSVRVGFRL